MISPTSYSNSSSNSSSDIYYIYDDCNSAVDLKHYRRNSFWKNMFFIDPIGGLSFKEKDEIEKAFDKLMEEI